MDCKIFNDETFDEWFSLYMEWMSLSGTKPYPKDYLRIEFTRMQKWNVDMLSEIESFKKSILDLTIAKSKHKLQIPEVEGFQQPFDF